MSPMREPSGGFETASAKKPDDSPETNEELRKEHSDILIFDAPFHTDPAMGGETLDDSGMRKEIPRGALSVATFLERKGFNANVVPMDAFLGQRPSDPSDGAESSSFDDRICKTVHRLIEEKDPKVVAFSYMFSPTEHSIEIMARYVRQTFPDKLVVIGGNAATFDDHTRQKLLNPEYVGADAITNFEGEWTMLDLMEEVRTRSELKQGETQSDVDLSIVKGLTYWNNGEIASTERRERGNPVEIGPLNYDKVILPEGVDIGDFNHYVLFSRGCLGRCAFCTSREMYRGVITDIGIDSFRQELEYVASAVARREGEEKNIGILDDDLLLEIEVWYDAEGNMTDKEDEASRKERKTIFEIIQPTLAEIHQKYPDINFISQARVGHLRGEGFGEVERNQNPKANTLLESPEEKLKSMKDCGINFMLLGIESGSQEILDASHKDTKVEWVEPACQKLRDAGIGVGAFWIIGLPGATREREEQSLAFLKDLVDKEMIDELEAHVFVPLPGTPARKSKTMRYDSDIDEKSQSTLFSGQVTYEHINEAGEVVLSKEEIQDIYERTKQIIVILKERQKAKGEISVVKNE